MSLMTLVELHQAKSLATWQGSGRVATSFMSCLSQRIKRQLLLRSSFEPFEESMTIVKDIVCQHRSLSSCRGSTNGINSHYLDLGYGVWRPRCSIRQSVEECSESCGRSSATNLCLPGTGVRSLVVRVGTCEAATQASAYLVSIWDVSTI